jgi:chromosome segregation protein
VAEAAAAADAREGSPAVSAAAPSGVPDWDAIEAEIEQLRERMGRMSNVNLAAVDELLAVEERLGFLVNQRDDLLAAKASLLDTISRVNKESRERFVTTFEEIRGHFRQIFRKLFRGGKADVSLADGEDVLEAGIEIVAAPPGKDARSITLLSGGERTLTAVGLLFALFRAKPSPVCMLDEVDAALDETNIDRFCTVLEDFLGSSQFVVVTHARRTMSYADTLFGITMEEHGVSKAVSLTLQEYRADESGSLAAGNGRKEARRIAGLVEDEVGTGSGAGSGAGSGNEERVLEQPA